MGRIVGLRKVLAALVLLAVGVVVTYFKGDVPAGLGSLLQNLFIAFVLGNGVEHAATVAKDYVSTKTPSEAGAVDLEPVLASLEEIKNAKGGQDLGELKVALNGIVNQNAVIADHLGKVAGGTQYLVNMVSGNQK